MATIALALGVAGYALSAHANHFGSGNDPGSAISGADRSVQNQAGNPDPAQLRQQWQQSLPGWAKDLLNHPEYMDRNGRMPGERGYRGPRTADAIAKSYGFEKRNGRWHYKGLPLPNQPGGSGMSWGSAPQNTQGGRQGAGACQGQCGNVPDKKP